jgi:hypothetical protein
MQDCDIHLSNLHLRGSTNGTLDGLCNRGGRDFCCDHRLFLLAQTRKRPTLVSEAAQPKQQVCSKPAVLEAHLQTVVPDLFTFHGSLCLDVCCFLWIRGLFDSRYTIA